MSWLSNVLAGKSKIKSELIELAEKAKDPTVSSRERLDALFLLGSTVQVGEKLQQEIDKVESEAEPKYRWVNGAKVKVRNPNG